MSIRNAARLVLECTVLACLFGISLDMVTANVAVEYFTIHHPHVVDSSSPWVMALVWGVGASWWFGVICGCILVAVLGRRKQPVPIVVVRRIVVQSCVWLWLLMVTMLAAIYSLIGLIPEHSRRTTFDYDRRIMSVALTHMTEYALGGILLLIVAIRLWRYA